MMPTMTGSDSVQAAELRRAIQEVADAESALRIVVKIAVPLLERAEHMDEAGALRATLAALNDAMCQLELRVSDITRPELCAA